MTVSNSDKEAIAARWDEILTASGGSHMLMAAAPTAGAAPARTPNIFCQDWLVAKKVLQALQPLVPQPGPIIIGVIIALGDAAFQKICPVVAQAPGQQSISQP